MNEEHTNACRKCGGAMKPGQAMQQTVECGDEGTCSPAGPGVLVDCMKCERCGWSVTAGGPEALAPDDLPPVHIDVERMRKALAGPRTLIPQGLSAQEVIDFIHANAGVDLPDGGKNG